MSDSNSTNNSNDIFKELMLKQRKSISSDKKLQFTDIKRICKYIKTSIFDPHGCSLWNGYITNASNSNKGTYINFYFRRKKVALHRLLYINFVDELHDDEYLKFSCNNKGQCCNINHLNKFRYQKRVELPITKTIKKDTPDTSEDSSDTPEELFVDFD